jgi:NADPH:quinone reductase
MHAVVLREFGPPWMLAVEDAPRQLPGPGQVDVAVEFASVSLVETQVRAAGHHTH